MDMPLKVPCFETLNRSIEFWETTLLDTCGCIPCVATGTAAVQICFATAATICGIALKVFAEICCFLGCSSLATFNFVDIKDDLAKLQNVFLRELVKGFLEIVPIIGNIAMGLLIFVRNQRHAVEDIVESNNRKIKLIEDAHEELMDQISALHPKIEFVETVQKELEEQIHAKDCKIHELEQTIEAHPAAQPNLEASAHDSGEESSSRDPTPAAESPSSIPNIPPSPTQASTFPLESLSPEIPENNESESEPVQCLQKQVDDLQRAKEQATATHKADQEALSRARCHINTLTTAHRLFHSLRKGELLDDLLKAVKSKSQTNGDTST